MGDPCYLTTDVFALGVILWELCTGQPANPGRNYRKVVHPGEAPEGICGIISRCMAFEPQDRPSAQDVHDNILASNNLAQQTPP